MSNNKLIKKALDLYSKGFSTKEISSRLGKSQRTIQRYIKRKDSIVEDNSDILEDFEIKFEHLWQLPEDQKPDKRIVGVIPDVHAPFTKLDYLKWLIKVFDDNNVTDIVCVGDMIDMHTLSMHQTSPNAMGTIDEYNKTKKIVKAYIKAFPRMKYCTGNHDTRLIKKASINGIPSEFMKSFKDLYGIPDTWEINKKFIIDDVLYTHGTEFSSRTAITSMTSITHKSTVVGHAHTQAGIFYTNSGFDQLFSMYCGCLIDSDKYAFEYAKDNKFKPILGCGIVHNSDMAYFIPYKEM